jgi:RNA-binding protein
MNLSESQKKFLRSKGHSLKPVITVGDSGLSESLLLEFESTIRHHELIKIRVKAGDRKLRNATIIQLCDTSGANLITRIGNVALVYRRNDEKPRIALPGA